MASLSELMEALGFCAMAYSFLVIPVVPSLQAPARVPSLRRQRARTVDCSRHWLKALSDKKGYHGSLPVPSVAPCAACVQWRRAPALALRAKKPRSTHQGTATANLVNEMARPKRFELLTPRFVVC